MFTYCTGTCHWNTSQPSPASTFPTLLCIPKVGPVIVSGEIREELLCVSSDGVIECINGNDCCYSDETLDHVKKNYSRN